MFQSHILNERKVEARRQRLVRVREVEKQLAKERAERYRQTQEVMASVVTTRAAAEWDEMREQARLKLLEEKRKEEERLGQAHAAAAELRQKQMADAVRQAEIWQRHAQLQRQRVTAAALARDEETQQRTMAQTMFRIRKSVVQLTEIQRTQAAVRAQKEEEQKRKRKATEQLAASKKISNSKPTIQVGIDFDEKGRPILQQPSMASEGGTQKGFNGATSLSPPKAVRKRYSIRDFESTHFHNPDLTSAVADRTQLPARATGSHHPRLGSQEASQQTSKEVMRRILFGEDTGRVAVDSGMAMGITEEQMPGLEVDGSPVKSTELTGRKTSGVRIQKKRLSITTVKSVNSEGAAVGKSVPSQQSLASGVQTQMQNFDEEGFEHGDDEIPRPREAIVVPTARKSIQGSSSTAQGHGTLVNESRPPQSQTDATAPIQPMHLAADAPQLPPNLAGEHSVTRATPPSSRRSSPRNAASAPLDGQDTFVGVTTNTTGAVTTSLVSPTATDARHLSGEEASHPVLGRPEPIPTTPRISTEAEIHVETCALQPSSSTASAVPLKPNDDLEMVPTSKDATSDPRPLSSTSQPPKGTSAQTTSPLLDAKKSPCTLSTSPPTGPTPTVAVSGFPALHENPPQQQQQQQRILQYYSAVDLGTDQVLPPSLMVESDHGNDADALESPMNAPSSGPISASMMAILAATKTEMERKATEETSQLRSRQADKRAKAAFSKMARAQKEKFDQQTFAQMAMEARDKRLRAVDVAAKRSASRRSGSEGSDIEDPLDREIARTADLERRLNRQFESAFIRSQKSESQERQKRDKDVPKALERSVDGEKEEPSQPPECVDQSIDSSKDVSSLCVRDAESNGLNVSGDAILDTTDESQVQLSAQPVPSSFPKEKSAEGAGQPHPEQTAPTSSHPLHVVAAGAGPGPQDARSTEFSVEQAQRDAENSNPSLKTSSKAGLADVNTTAKPIPPATMVTSAFSTSSDMTKQNQYLRTMAPCDPRRSSQKPEASTASQVSQAPAPAPVSSSATTSVHTSTTTFSFSSLQTSSPSNATEPIATDAVVHKTTTSASGPSFNVGKTESSIRDVVPDRLAGHTLPLDSSASTTTVTLNQTHTNTTSSVSKTFSSPITSSMPSSTFPSPLRSADQSTVLTCLTNSPDDSFSSFLSRDSDTSSPKPKHKKASPTETSAAPLSTGVSSSVPTTVFSSLSGGPSTSKTVSSTTLLSSQSDSALSIPYPPVPHFLPGSIIGRHNFQGTSTASTASASTSAAILPVHKPIFAVPKIPDSSMSSSSSSASDASSINLDDLLKRAKMNHLRRVGRQQDSSQTPSSSTETGSRSTSSISTTAPQTPPAQNGQDPIHFGSVAASSVTTSALSSPPLGTSSAKGKEPVASTGPPFVDIASTSINTSDTSISSSFEFAIPSFLKHPTLAESGAGTSTGPQIVLTDEAGAGARRKVELGGMISSTDSSSLSSFQFDDRSPITKYPFTSTVVPTAPPPAAPIANLSMVTDKSLVVSESVGSDLPDVSEVEEGDTGVMEASVSVSSVSSCE